MAKVYVQKFYAFIVHFLSPLSPVGPLILQIFIWIYANWSGWSRSFGVSFGVSKYRSGSEGSELLFENASVTVTEIQQIFV